MTPDASADATADRARAWSDAMLAAGCIAIDPAGLGGVRLRASAGAVRDRWIAGWRASLVDGAPVRGVPLHVDDERLLGGIDLVASLRTGRPVRQAGVLADARGGFVVLSMAERIAPATAARIAAALDDGGFGVVALDEGEDDEALGAVLAERLALCVDLRGLAPRDVAVAPGPRHGGQGEVADVADDRPSENHVVHGYRGPTPSDHVARVAIDDARRRLADVAVDDAVVAALCDASMRLGIDSMRPALFALRCARAVAALAGHDAVDADDAACAARLVFASRVRRLPQAEADAADAAADDRADDPAADEADSRDGRESGDAMPSNDDSDPSPSGPPPSTDPTSRSDAADADDAGDLETRVGPTADVVVAAAVAVIPAGLLAALADGAAAARGRSTHGGSGARSRSRLRGAPAGVRRARPRGNERLSLVETLRAAAPWQAARRADAATATRRDEGPPATRRADASSTKRRIDAPPAPRPGGRVHVRVEDLHVVRFRSRQPATTVFVVDASGSSALHRLAEAKGAVELLLADCYVRRDRVAVVAFRGRDAQLLLPPTRSLARARRSLAALPGGGGTPLATALDATRELVVALRRSGETVFAVVLTDGRANVARDGTGGRPKAEADASSAARAFRTIGVDALLIDTSPTPHAQAARLAAEMGAAYRPLPQADARAMSRVVNAAARRATDAGRASTPR